MLKLAKYLKKYKKQVILGPIFKLIEAIFELIVPVITAKMIDNGVRPGNVDYIWRMGGVMLLLGIVGLCCALVGQKFAAVASQGFGTVVRSKMYEHINTFSHFEIDKFGTSSIITRITNDVNQLQYAVAMLIRRIIRAPFLAVGAIVMAMIINCKLAIIFLVATPLIAFVLYMIMSRSVPYFKIMQKKLDDISLISQEGLNGVRVIRAFSKQKSEEKRFNTAADDQTNIAIMVGKLSAILNPMTYAIINFGVIAIVWFGGWQVNYGNMTQGEVIAFVNYMSQTLLALIVVADLVVTFTKAVASTARVNEIFDTVTSVSETNEKPVTRVQNTPKIDFQGVSFSYYGSDKYAVRDLNVSIMAGETIGIIGGTGSGKSTLVSLIPRFYDVTKGKILIDGVNVRDYSFAELRGEIGMVPQESVLFSGTIESNLRWGRRDATREELNKALELAQAADFVLKMPEGIESSVNQGGKNFSGGQKQRLTIARALVGSVEILILDDSSSALDFATDAALRKSIKSETNGMTVLIVSQRVSTIKYADKIIVLDNGEVAGIGTHEQLMESCKIYQEICLSQLSKDEVDRR